MSRWLSRLHQDLQGLEASGLRRSLSTARTHGYHIDLGGERLINVSSNDYLGLSQDPRIEAAAVAALRKYGAGAGSSRLVGGHWEAHERVEARFARFKGAEAGLLFPTGYMANLGVLTSLVRREDLVCIDKLSHASLVDAARGCPGRVRVYPHLGYGKLGRLLEAHASASPDASRFVVTDAVFSMDGDVADLVRLSDFAERFGAVLVVDEAHGTGVLGERGAGLCERVGVEGRVDVVVSTASKALGCLGGVVTGKRVVIDTLVNRARSFIYTTAVPAAQAAGIEAALDIVEAEPWRRERLCALSVRLRDGLAALGWASCRPAGGVVTPIVPLVVGGADAALSLADHLRAGGFFAPAIRPPTVAKGGSRVRLSVRADIPEEQIDRLVGVVSRWRRGG